MPRRILLGLMCAEDLSSTVSIAVQSASGLQSKTSTARGENSIHCPHIISLSLFSSLENIRSMGLTKTAILWAALLSTGSHQALGLSLSSSSVFHGSPLLQSTPSQQQQQRYHTTSFLEMRKQKASDRRTRRLQRGDIAYAEELAKSTVGAVTSSPMAGKAWRHKQTHSMQAPVVTGGRGRSRKRSALYNSLSLYHNKFLSLLTEEYKQEVRTMFDGRFVHGQ